MSLREDIHNAIQTFDLKQAEDGFHEILNIMLKMNDRITAVENALRETSR